LGVHGVDRNVKKGFRPVALHDLMMSLGALALVVGLLLLVRPVLHALGARRGAGQDVAMGVEGVLALDRTRRLTLVRCDGRRALVLSGGASDQIVAWPEMEA